MEEINFFGVGFKTAKAFVKASNEGIGEQIASAQPLPIDDLVMEIEKATKGGTGEIPAFVQRKIQALEFRFGQGNYYYYDAIEQYLNTLLKYPYLKFIVIENADGSLFGYFDAKVLNTFLNELRENGYRKFERILNNDFKDQLYDFPGFLELEQTARSTENRQTILKRMEQFNLEVLPVINQDKVFIGTIDRSRLLASLIIDFANRIEDQNK